MGVITEVFGCKIAQIIEVYKVAATPSENIPNILLILDQIGLSVEG